MERRLSLPIEAGAGRVARPKRGGPRRRADRAPRGRVEALAGGAGGGAAELCHRAGRGAVGHVACGEVGVRERLAQLGHQAGFDSG